MTRQPNGAKVELGDGRLRLGRSAMTALRLLETCPLVPVDAFAQLAGLSSVGGAYKQLANLRRTRLAEVQRIDLGYLLGERPLGLWRITEHGRLALHASGVKRPCQDADKGPHELRLTRQHSSVDQRGTNLTVRVAAYRMLALLVAERAAQGQKDEVLLWQQPWVRVVWSWQESKSLRVKLPAGAVVISREAAAAKEPPISGQRTVLLIPDLGTAPVDRYREMLRRLLAARESSADPAPEVVVATTDPDGKGTRASAWMELMDRAARKGEQPELSTHVVSWQRVASVLAGRADLPGVFGNGSQQRYGRRRGATTARAARAPTRGREQVLHLVGRHPLLTAGQIARLLGTSIARIKRLEQELIESGWLRRIELDELPHGGIGLDFHDFGSLCLVEVTLAGRRRLATWLGLEPMMASRYHGLIGIARGHAGRRKRLLQTLAHTIGANGVFVAFAVAAESARAHGGTDLLTEWRSAAACERRQCKPDGYGCYVRDGLAHGFFLEYDRGTEPTRRYAGKFHAYYHYRDSGQARRDYDGFPTILFVTTRQVAEHRIAEESYRSWSLHNTEPLPILTTTTQRIADHPEGILGPIWRTPAASPLVAAPSRRYWLPGGPPAGSFGRRSDASPNNAARYGIRDRWGGESAAIAREIHIQTGRRNS